MFAFCGGLIRTWQVLHYSLFFLPPLRRRYPIYLPEQSSEMRYMTVTDIIRYVGHRHFGGQ